MHVEKCKANAPPSSPIALKMVQMRCSRANRQINRRAADERKAIREVLPRCVHYASPIFKCL
ncbi:hypothetical protein AS026_02170 [Rhizobium altiplani]|uniref:Uncharacterized protein n=1 Tax=Rhizobium altiplani TaxID=1864509 RepID=A0A109K3T5_9HYPH|nr:hypothetical protein AS026_02170 [Rhizobium altiplani]